MNRSKNIWVIFIYFLSETNFVLVFEQSKTIKYFDH